MGKGETDIINTEQYQIEKAQYLVQSVRGDEWVLFSPPFDVTNVYVLEAYPETYLEELATTNRGRSYELQAEANMDFFFQYCYQIVEMNTRDDFYYIYNAWKRDNSKFEKGAGLTCNVHRVFGIGTKRTKNSQLIGNIYLRIQ